MSTFDASEVARQARALLGSGEDAQAFELFAQSLLDWSDDYAANLADDAESEEARVARVGIAKLWVEYGTLLVEVRPFSEAQKVFEEAGRDPIASCSFELFDAFTQMCRSRSKDKAEQGAFLLGLCSEGLSQPDLDKLWLKFVEYFRYITMKRPGSRGLDSQLTLRVVYGETCKQTDLPGRLRPPSAAAYDEEAARLLGSGTSSSSINMDTGNVSRTNSGNAMDFSQAESKEDQSSSAPQYNALLADFSDLEDASGLPPKVLMAAFFRPTPMLLYSDASSSRGLAAQLPPSKLSELEAFLGCSIDVAATTGSADGPSPRAALLLNALEGLWALQVLKERQFQTWGEQLRKQFEKKDQEQRAALEEARKVSNVEFMKLEHEYKKFLEKNCVQTEVLAALFNKTMFSLVLQQLKLLRSFDFPTIPDELISKLDIFFRTNKTEASVNVFDSDMDLARTISNIGVMVRAALGLKLSQADRKRSQPGATVPKSVPPPSKVVNTTGLFMPKK